MKLFHLDHICIIPYTACNFRCPYCVAQKHQESFKLWDNNIEGINRFLKDLSPRAIMVSGGEPLLFDWSRLIKDTPHCWYFFTNLSSLPKWIKECRNTVKFFMPAFHRTQTTFEKFSGNVKILQDLGFPVFVKIVHLDDIDKLNVEKFWKTGIVASLTPESNTHYQSTPTQCLSVVYKNRYNHTKKLLSICRAGTKESFEIRGRDIYRCSHWNFPYTLIDKLGTIDNPHLHKRPYVCSNRTCYCEWLRFTELMRPNDNEQWEKFVATGKWNELKIEYPIKQS